MFGQKSCVGAVIGAYIGVYCGKCVTPFRLQGFVYMIKLNYEICVNYSPPCDGINIRRCPGLLILGKINHKNYLLIYFVVYRRQCSALGATLIFATR